MSVNLFRSGVLLTLVFMLGACGFHLRGYGESAALPASLQTLRLDSEAGNGVARELRQRLNRSDVNVVEEASVPRLLVGSESVRERVVSLNSSARAGEFALMLEVEFLLTDDDTVLAGPETLTTEQVYLADPENPIAKSEESQLILDEMRAALADRIMRQLRSIAP